MWTIISCSNPEPVQAKNPDADKIRVRTFVALDTANSGNTIVLAKRCTEHMGFKYIYQLQDGTWVASNESWCVDTKLNISVAKN